MKPRFLRALVIAVGFAAGFAAVAGCGPAPAERPVEGGDFKHWSAVDGKVRGVESYAPQKDNPGGFTIYYTYLVQGKTYRSSSFRYYSDSKEIESLLEVYPNGSKITVQYDPADPRRSYVLQPNPRAVI